MADAAEQNMRDALVQTLEKVCASAQTVKKKAKKRDTSGKKKKKQRLLDEDELKSADGDPDIVPDIPGEEENVITDISPGEMLITRGTEEVKRICKAFPESAPKFACSTLLKRYLAGGLTSGERLRALNLCNVLFVRSGKFRSCLCDNIAILLDAVFGSHVPGPNPALLRETAEGILRKWYQDFGSKYPQLELALNSSKIPLEAVKDTSQTGSEQIRQNAIEHKVNVISRGFRIFDGANLSGEGEEEAALLEQVKCTLKEADEATELLLPFLSDSDAVQDTQRFSSNSGEAIANEEFNTEEVEWEDEDNDEGDNDNADIENPYFNQFDFMPEAQMNMPSSVTVTIDSKGDNRDDLADVRAALLDKRLTIEKSLLPTLIEWTGYLEEQLGARPSTTTASVLMRVKRLVQDLRDAVGRCNRLNILPKTRSVRNPLGKQSKARVRKQPHAG